MMNALTHLLADAAPATTAAASATLDPAAAEMSGAAGVVGMIGTFLPMILIFVVFYFLLIRPQRKKDKEA